MSPFVAGVFHASPSSRIEHPFIVIYAINFIILYYIPLSYLIYILIYTYTYIYINIYIYIIYPPPRHGGTLPSSRPVLVLKLWRLGNPLFGEGEARPVSTCGFAAHSTAHLLSYVSPSQNTLPKQATKQCGQVASLQLPVPGRHHHHPLSGLRQK